MELRPYQTEAAQAVRKEWEEGRRRTLLVLPTGTGKTIVFCKLAEEEVREGRRVLILAHRNELLEQAADKMRRATGLGCSVEKAEQTSFGEWYRITVGSVQTMSRERRLEMFDREHFDTIIVDEAHHALSDTYQTVLGHFESASVLGVTATPDRGDLRSLGAYFESLAFEYSLPQAIREGYLTPIRAQTIPLTIDMDGVRSTAGDFRAADVSNALDPYLERIAGEIARRASGRRTVVFTPLIATSLKLLGYLQAAGVEAMEVNGESPDRGEIIGRFASARPGAVLLNSMLLTEGWDCPSVDCVVVLRATKVRSLYCQMVGRGTRLSPETGKENLLLLDFLWHSSRHELCRPAHLVVEDEETAQAMTRITEAAADPGEFVDLIEAEVDAQSEVVREREERLAEKLRNLRNKKARLVDPLQYEMSIQDASLASYKPSFGWEAQPPTMEQREALFKLDIAPDAVECAGKAARLIEAVERRREANLATPKQIRFLEARGFRHVGQWGMADAKRLVDRIAANGWRTPGAIDPATYVPAGT